MDHTVVPGTTTLVDIDGTIQTAHSKNHQDIVLIPTPSDDRDDPLNWTPRRKWLSVFCTVVYMYGVGVPTAAIYSVLTNISKETGITLSQLNAGTGYMFLFLGLGCCIFQPIALQYGKRPVLLFSMFGTCLVCVWAPYSKSSGEWIGSKILQGFLGSPIESLCEIAISDVFFEHERALGLAVYSLSLSTSNYMASVISGFITSGIGWQWVMWMCAIFAAVCFVFLFFFLEETNFNRKVKSSTTIEVIESSEIGEKNQVKEEVASISVHSEKPMKTYRQKLSLTGGKIDRFILPGLFMGAIKMAQFPSVLWAGFINGSSLVWFNLLNGTASKILSGEPYNFTPTQRGIAYLSPVIFCVVFWFFVGPMSDRLKIWLARRRNGVSYAEDRLWMLILRMVFGLLASIGWGVGAYYGIPWGILGVSMGVLGGSGIFSSTASVTYVTDCYHEMATEAMVVVMIIRNTMSFACSYGLTHWVVNLGYKRAFISSGFCLFGSMGTFIIMRYTGPYWRNRTKEAYWKLVEKQKRMRGELQ
jgi:MFS family permease